MVKSGDEAVMMRRVLVLMAVHDGELWLEEQLRSILSQQGVSVHILVSVDSSSDGSESILSAFVQSNPGKITIKFVQFASSAHTFFDLSRSAGRVCDEYDYIAFSDQDDVWFESKLERGIEKIEQTGSQALSSDALAVWPDGKSSRLKKGMTQRRYDHLFESAGPGCTYLFKVSVFKEFLEWDGRRPGASCVLSFHDWPLYAWVRTRGYRWIMNPEPTLQYRQHLRNVMGANIGIAAMVQRLSLLFSGWYLSQVVRVAEYCQATSEAPIRLLIEDSWTNRIRLLRYAGQCRRRRRDQILLAIAFLFAKRCEGDR
jgi:rhamnosyltransferase